MKNNLNDFLSKTGSFKDVFNSIPLHIVLTDPDGNVLFANKTAEKITGFTEKEMMGKTPRLWGKQMGKDFYEDFWKEIKDKKKIFSGIVKNKRKSGAIYYAAAKVSPLLNSKGGLIGFCGVEQDITEIQKLSDQHDLTRAQRDVIKRSINL